MEAWVFLLLADEPADEHGFRNVDAVKLDGRETWDMVTQRPSPKEYRYGTPA